MGPSRLPRNAACDRLREKLTLGRSRGRCRWAIRVSFCKRKNKNKKWSEACKRLIKDCIICWNVELSLLIPEAGGDG